MFGNRICSYYDHWSYYTGTCRGTGKYQAWLHTCLLYTSPATHLDFLIYNRIAKKPVLAIEVDGYKYHKEDTVQTSRDLLKNHIMDLYEIPLLRFKTNGSGEKERIVEKLDKLVG